MTSSWQKDTLNYLDLKKINPFMLVEIKHDTRVRKYARYGKTSHRRELEICSGCRIFNSTPENTLIFKDSSKTDRVRTKTVKTRFVGARTQGVCTDGKKCFQ